MTTSYCASSNLRLLIRILMALAFLPIPEVQETFDRIVILYRREVPVLNRMIEYFKFQCIPIISIWNVHCHHIRTNNDLEGWHFSMKRIIKRTHLDIFTFIGIQTGGT